MQAHIFGGQSISHPSLHPCCLSTPFGKSSVLISTYLPRSQLKGPPVDFVSLFYMIENSPGRRDMNGGAGHLVNHWGGLIHTRILYQPKYILKRSTNINRYHSSLGLPTWECLVSFRIRICNTLNAQTTKASARN